MRANAKPTVLVVDDDRLIREGVADVLASAGYHVWCAASGEEALELAQRNHPDAVVTDLRMPGMDGIALLDRLATLASPPPRTAIIYSAAPPIEAAALEPRGVRWVAKAPGHAGLIHALADVE